MALRILLKSIDSHASRHGRFIKPLLSISIDFYVRCFVQLDSSARLAKDCASKLSHVFACSSCHSLELQPLIKKTINGPSTRFTNSSFHSSMIISSHQEAKQNGDASVSGSQCVHCGAKTIHMAGPIYTAPMHDTEFVKRLLQGIKETPQDDRLGTHERMLGVLTVVSEEIHDVPLYYEHDQLMAVVKCTVPKHLLVRSAIINAGFKCSISHCNAKALKTDAPVTFLWDFARYWNNVNPEKFPDGSSARTILSAKNSYVINFTTNPLAIPRSRTDCLLRFQDNKGKIGDHVQKQKVLLPRRQQAFRRSRTS
uniref:tRNA (guanine(26)-N(2))-dimethyltransferase n=1 Tax=Ditylenchus dipsaci TaxID=166011 RepID=A0A915DCW1_9BILA